MSVVPPTSTNGTQSAKGKGYNLQTEDFIKMMITQLQNQDPMEPAKNAELLAQMSQIGQLQSSEKLQSSLKTMVLQNQIASAGNLIGKMVEGTDAYGEKINGLVDSVRVADDTVTLELDNGKELVLDKVTNISDAEGTAVTPQTGADGVTVPMAA